MQGRGTSLLTATTGTHCSLPWLIWVPKIPPLKNISFGLQITWYILWFSIKMQHFPSRILFSYFSCPYLNSYAILLILWRHCGRQTSRVILSALPPPYCPLLLLLLLILPCMEDLLCAEFFICIFSFHMPNNLIP